MAGKIVRRLPQGVKRSTYQEMTEAEQHRIIGQVVSEMAAAKKRLACLEFKAGKMALQFGLLTNWLNGHFPTGVELSDGIAVDEALALVAEIKAVKVEIEHLKGCQSKLGIAP